MHKGETAERRKTFPTLDCANCVLTPLCIAFPQAVLNKYVVDKRDCPPCRFACPTGAITSNNFTIEQIMAEIESVLVRAFWREGKSGCRGIRGYSRRV